MPADAITRTFHEWGKANGFRRKGTTIYRERGEIVAVVNLQGSQWGGRKYVNVAWWFLAIGEADDPPVNRCHIYARLGAFVPSPDVLEQVLRDDGGLTEADREQCFRNILDEYLAPHLAATETLAQIKRNEGGWLNRVGVKGPAQKALASA